MTTIVRPRSTKKYHTLIALGFTDEDALKALVEPEPESEPLPEFPVLQKLMESGNFTQEEAEAVLARMSSGEPTHPVAPAPVVLTAKQKAEALVESSKFDYTKGRVYITPDMLAGFSRVFKTGTPEIVTTSGVGHIAAVLVYREESGDVALQNLKTKE